MLNCKQTVAGRGRGGAGVVARLGQGVNRVAYGELKNDEWPFDEPRGQVRAAVLQARCRASGATSHTVQYKWQAYQARR